MARPAMLVDPAVTALAQTSGFSREERRAIITLIRKQTMRTHAVGDACSQLSAQMGARDFEWPEFDRWQMIFARCGAFPPLWDGLDRRLRPDHPDPARQAYRRQKLYLLIDWLHGLVATRAEMRAALTRYTLQGRPAQIVRQSADITCPACDPLNHESVQHGAELVPPFHPGCRCLILAAHSTTRLS
jgi:hypothetical protein